MMRTKDVAQMSIAPHNCSMGTVALFLGLNRTLSKANTPAGSKLEIVMKWKMGMEDKACDRKSQL